MALPVGVEKMTDDFFSKISSISSYASISNDGNKYELYIYTIAHKALSANFTLNPKGLNGSVFKFRCSPGKVDNKYSYFSFGDYELRNGIEVIGHILEHEIDVCVIENPKALDLFRPDKDDLLLALECKSYSSASSLKGECRKNLGAISDLSEKGQTLNGHVDVGCMHLGFSFHKVFVTNVPKTQGIKLQNFLRNYDLNPKFGVIPHSLAQNALNKEIRAVSSKW